MINHGLLYNYCFPTEIRSKLVEKLGSLAPTPLEKVFLLSTGSESTECAIKLARTYGVRKSGIHKKKIITFENAFHGRTLGAQMAGGSPGAKTWIVNLDPDINQVPFPNGYLYAWAEAESLDYSEENCFSHFLKALSEQGIEPEQIAGIMIESYQGGWVQLLPKGYAKRLRAFCDEYDIILIFDEVQSGIGRTGRFFAFEHYDVIPDLVCCGKGLSSSLPISAVIGRSDIMDLYGPNEMTSTHTGNPLCCAAALANLNYLIDKQLIDNAFKLGKICLDSLLDLKNEYSKQIGCVNGVGLVWGVLFISPISGMADPTLARRVVDLCIQKGLLLFAPVGNGAVVKLCPPLTIQEDALIDGLTTFAEAVKEAVESY